MKNINNNDFRNILKGVIIGGLIFGSIGVAAGTLTAKEIKYTPSNEKFTVTNAEEALNEIYKIAEYKIPENTYFYEEGTEGDSATIVRYKKINDEYFVCDANGIVLEGTAATDVSSKTLIEYRTTSVGNLSAGSAGYASNSFLLGDGSNNSDYYEQGKSESVYEKYIYNNCLSGFREENLNDFADCPSTSSIEGAVSCMVVYVTDIPDYKKKTLNDFIIEAHAYHESNGVYKYGYIYNASLGRITIYPISGGRFTRGNISSATVYVK